MEDGTRSGNLIIMALLFYFLFQMLRRGSSEAIQLRSAMGVQGLEGMQGDSDLDQNNNEYIETVSPSRVWNCIVTFVIVLVFIEFMFFSDRKCFVLNLSGHFPRNPSSRTRRKGIHPHRRLRPPSGFPRSPSP